MFSVAETWRFDQSSFSADAAAARLVGGGVGGGEGQFISSGMEKHNSNNDGAKALKMAQQQTGSERGKERVLNWQFGLC